MTLTFLPKESLTLRVTGTPDAVAGRLRELVSPVWFGGLLFGSAMIAGVAIRSSPTLGAGLAASVPSLLAGGAMLLAAYVLMIRSFRSEAKRAHALLCDGLGAASGSRLGMSGSEGRS